MKKWAQAESSAILVRIRREVRVAGGLSCRCEHLQGKARKTLLELVKIHFLAAFGLLRILQLRAPGFKAQTMKMFELIELWVLDQFGKVSACLKMA